MAERLDKQLRDQERSEMSARLKARIEAMPLWKRWRFRWALPRDVDL
jgi:hypothetical protein